MSKANPVLDSAPIQSEEILTEVNSTEEINLDDLLKNAATREGASIQAPKAAVETASNFERACEIQSQDHEGRIEARKVFVDQMIGLLWVQNIFVFVILFVALLDNRMKDLEIVLSTVIGGTLLETGFVVKVIVKFVFAEIDHSKGPLAEKG